MRHNHVDKEIRFDEEKPLLTRGFSTEEGGLKKGTSCATKFYGIKVLWASCSAGGDSVLAKSIY